MVWESATTASPANDTDEKSGGVEGKKDAVHITVRVAVTVL